MSFAWLPFGNPRYAWLAGIVEGEGCISVHYTHKIRGGERREYPYPQLRIAMADEDVIRRCAEVAAPYGGGGVYEQKVRSDHHKVLYQFTITGDPCRRLLEVLSPYFGERRLAKAKEVVS